MQQVNNTVALVQAQQKCHTPIPSEDKRKEPLSELTVSMVLALFARMGALFRNKARAEGLLIYMSDEDEERGFFSETFKLWCVKLRDLTADDFQAGTLAMEQKAEAMYQCGEQMWPPSFAEFRALCFPANDFDKQAHKVLPSVFDPRCSQLFLEDQTAKEQRYELGKQKSRELLDMLGASKTNPNAGDAEFGKARLEAAIMKLAQESAQ